MTKVLKDDRINHFFDGVEVARLRDHQKAFLTAALGGPNTYTGKDLAEAHKQLAASGFDDAHFDAAAGHLNDTLEDLSVPHELISEVMAIVESTRADVLKQVKNLDCSIKAMPA